jgi:hypothetical protein
LFSSDSSAGSAGASWLLTRLLLLLLLPQTLCLLLLELRNPCLCVTLPKQPFALLGVNGTLLGRPSSPPTITILQTPTPPSDALQHSQRFRQLLTRLTTPDCMRHP